jgi:cyclic pyranopterin phosphate synthase
VNISLDSLDRERFAEVTCGGKLDQTLNGIKAAQDAGLTPIKLNTVLRRSTWKQDVPLLLDYAANTGLEIRFIELMRTGTELVWCDAERITVDEVLEKLGAECIPLTRSGVAPARNTLVNWRGAYITIGWIAPHSHPFCDRCERLRMDARGQVRRCLMDASTFDLRYALRTSDPETVRAGFHSYLAGKQAPLDMDSSLAMSQIGG